MNLRFPDGRRRDADPAAPEALRVRARPGPRAGRRFAVRAALRISARVIRAGPPAGGVTYSPSGQEGALRPSLMCLPSVRCGRA
ncbi:hypothetical protein DF19_20450 [Streptomyces olindensis]|nr:hypothetical protein DF19_20450 [Streptomyces olindensis]